MHTAPPQRSSPPRTPTTTLAFLATFLAAWFALDRLATSPPVAVSAVLALVVSGAVLVVSERLTTGRRLGEILDDLGLGRPPTRSMVAATVVGGALVATYLGGAALLGIELQLRSNWPSVLVGALLFHGVAEELVWRGYVYGRFRRTNTFAGAVLRTTPLIALTHVPILVSSGLTVGSLAVLTAAITCLPLAYLYDHGHRTVWPPAIVHGLIGTWQLFDRPFPAELSVVVMCSSILVPLTAFAFRPAFFTDDSTFTDDSADTTAKGHR